MVVWWKRALSGFFEGSGGVSHRPAAGERPVKRGVPLLLVRDEAGQNLRGGGVSFIEKRQYGRCRGQQKGIPETGSAYVSCLGASHNGGVSRLKR